MSKSLKVLGKDDQAVVRVEVDAKKKVTTTTHTVKPDGDSPNRYNLTWKFDFQGVTEAELMELAERNLRIKMQAAWRKADDRMKGEVWDNRTFKVRDLLDNTRQTKTAAEKVNSLVDKLTAEEKAALLAKLAEK